MFRNPSLVTSNISEVNIRLPGATDKSDPIEIPIPEQFVSKIIAASAGNYKVDTQNVSHG